MMHSGYKRLDFVLVPSSCGDLLAKDLSESSSWAGYLRLSTRISSRSVFNNSRLACRDRTRPADGDEHLQTVSTFSFFRSFLFHYSHIFLLFSWLTLVKLGLWVSVFCASFSYPSIPSYIFHEQHVHHLLFTHYEYTRGITSQIQFSKTRRENRNRLRKLSWYASQVRKVQAYYKILI